MPLFSCKLITSHIILESRTPDYWKCQSLHLLMQLCVCACVCVWFQSSQEKETNIVHREPCIILNATHFLLCCQNTKQHFLLSVKFNQMSDSFHYVTDHLKTYWLKLFIEFLVLLAGWAQWSFPLQISYFRDESQHQKQCPLMNKGLPVVTCPYHFLTASFLIFQPSTFMQFQI